jgi:hypothetical protein
VTIGAAVQAMLVGMPAPRDLHRSEVDGQVFVAVGATVLFSYAADDAGLRNLAAVTLPEMGFTGRRARRIDTPTARLPRPSDNSALALAAQLAHPGRKVVATVAPITRALARRDRGSFAAEAAR